MKQNEKWVGKKYEIFENLPVRIFLLRSLKGTVRVE